MSVFYREHFRTGIMIIEDKDADGNVVKKMIKSKENGTDIGIQDDVHVKGKYFGWLHADKAAMDAAKAAAKQKKADAKKPKGKPA